MSEFTELTEDAIKDADLSPEAEGMLKSLLKAIGIAEQAEEKDDYTARVREDEDFVYAANDPDGNNCIGVFKDALVIPMLDPEIPTPGVYIESAALAENIGHGAYLPYSLIPNLAFSLLAQYARILDVPGLVEAVEDAEVNLHDAFAELYEAEGL